MFANDDEVFGNIRALADSNVLIAQATNDGFTLKQFYKPEADSREIYYENYGSWTLQSGIIDERETKIISRRRQNLRGKTITSSFVELQKGSRKHVSDFVDKNVDSLMKLNYIIVHNVLDNLNATKKDIFQGAWGYYNERSKKWSGMIGDMVHKGAEIGGEIFGDNFSSAFIKFNNFSRNTTLHYRRSKTVYRLHAIQHTNSWIVHISFTSTFNR
jgi:hypothetical protein